MLENSFVKRASISFIGRNLLYFAEKTDIDIEQYANYASSGYSVQGGSGLQTPTMRRYGFNINITF
jgi:hypothetical protein